MDTTSVFATVAVGARRARHDRRWSPPPSAPSSRRRRPPAVAPMTSSVADDGAVADPNADADRDRRIRRRRRWRASPASSSSLERGGAPIYIDEFERIALDSLRGQFSVPGQAQAELERHGQRQPRHTARRGRRRRRGVDLQPRHGRLRDAARRLRHRPFEVLRSRERLAAAARQPSGRHAWSASTTAAASATTSPAPRPRRRSATSRSGSCRARTSPSTSGSIPTRTW